MLFEYLNGRRLSAVAASVFCLFVLGLSGCAVVPKPLEIDEKTHFIREDQQALFKGQVPITSPLKLEEAMARAVAYNLDHRTRMIEEAMAWGQFELARFDMLPVLAAKAGYTSRNKEEASFSRGYWDRILSKSPTTSDEKSRLTADLGLSWNILDFGVSYYQAQQEADRYLISQGNRQKLVQRMLHQTRVAYMRAYAAQVLKPEVKRTLDECRTALDHLNILAKERVQAPLTTLQNRRALLELIGQLEAIEQSLLIAEVELKSLINVKPSQELILKAPACFDAPPVITLDIEDLELAALQNSLDIEEQIYNARIERNESRKALLRLFPGLELGFSGHYDSNSYLVHKTWTEASSHVTWNLMRLFSAPRVREIAEVREDLAKVRRLALNMAVISRLHISWQRYQDSANQVVRARELDDLEREIVRHTRATVAADAGSKVERIRSEASSLRAKLRRYEAQANTQDAFGLLLMSLGLDAVPTEFQTMNLEELTAAISRQLEKWDAGVLPGPILSPGAGMDRTSEFESK